MTGDTSTPPRRATRAKVFQPGEMHTIAGAQRIHLLDISEAGALVYSTGPIPAVGAVVRLTVGTPIGAARVKWAAGKRFGVSFATPLSSSRVAQLLSVQGTPARQADRQR